MTAVHGFQAAAPSIETATMLTNSSCTRSATAVLDALDGVTAVSVGWPGLLVAARHHLGGRTHVLAEVPPQAAVQALHHVHQVRLVISGLAKRAEQHGRALDGVQAVAPDIADHGPHAVSRVDDLIEVAADRRTPRRRDIARRDGHAADPRRRRYAARPAARSRRWPRPAAGRRARGAGGARSRALTATTLKIAPTVPSRRPRPEATSCSAVPRGTRAIPAHSPASRTHCRRPVPTLAMAGAAASSGSTSIWRGTRNSSRSTAAHHTPGRTRTRKADSRSGPDRPAPGAAAGGRRREGTAAPTARPPFGPHIVCDTSIGLACVVTSGVVRYATLPGDPATHSAASRRLHAAGRRVFVL